MSIAFTCVQSETEQSIQVFIGSISIFVHRVGPPFFSISFYVKGTHLRKTDLFIPGEGGKALSKTEFFTSPLEPGL